MISLLDKNIKTIFLQKNSTFRDVAKYNIILSPEFYWVRIFEIPTNNKKQIQNLLPTLFEEILPDDEYNYYFTHIMDKKYLCFAYKTSEVIKKIQNSGLNINKLQNIYFLQTELKEKTPFFYNDFTYILKDEIVIQVPNYMVKDDNKQQLDLNKINLSSQKIKFNIHQNLISTKNIYKIVFILSILLCLNILKDISYSSSINEIINKKISIIKENNLPKTSFELNSIKQSFENTNSKQLKIRDISKQLFSLYKNFEKFEIESIEYSKQIRVSLKYINFDQFRKYFENYKIKLISENKNSLIVEIKL